MNLNAWEQVDGPAEYFGPEDLRKALEEYSGITEQLAAALRVSVALQTEEYRASAWHPHVPQMDAALARFRQLCRRELEKIGCWREDAPDPAEIHDLVSEAGERLVAWLLRIMGTPVPPTSTAQKAA